MPAANRIGRHEDRVPGQPGAGGAAGDHEQRDLGRGVEAEAEEHADRVHLLRLVTVFVEPPEEAVHEAAAVELLLERLLVVAAALHLPEDLDDPDEDHDVQRGDHVEERAGDERADPAGDLVQPELPLWTGPASDRTPSESRNASANTIVE